RRTTPGGEGSTPLATGITTTSFADATATNGTTYYYKVTAVNANSSQTPPPPSESGASAEIFATPQAQLVAQIHFVAKNGGDIIGNYLGDIGLAYGSRGDGLTFGWNKDNTANGRDRDRTISPDELHDGLALMQRSNNPNAWWGIAVPDGTYQVHIIAGDPSYIDSVYKINVGGVLSSGKVSGGVLAINGRPTMAKRWFENTVTVTVTGGVLYVSNAPGSSNDKIDEIDISQAQVGAQAVGGTAGPAAKPGLPLGAMAPSFAGSRLAD